MNKDQLIVQAEALDKCLYDAHGDWIAPLEVRKVVTAVAITLRAQAEAMPAQEVIGERCIDGGKCHHRCESKCFRRECCGPLSGYTGPWKYEEMPAQEPVAWRCDWAYWRQYHDECNPLPDRWDRDDVPTITPLYTAPPDQTARIKELEGLLHDAKERISHSAIHDVDCSLCEGCKIEERIRAALLAALTKGE